MFGQGISQIGSLLDLATETGIVKKSGSWFSFDGERLGQGRENAKDFLMENPKIAETIDHQIRVLHNISNEDAAEKQEIDEESDAVETTEE